MRDEDIQDAEWEEVPNNEQRLHAVRPQVDRPTNNVDPDSYSVWRDRSFWSDAFGSAKNMVVVSSLTGVAILLLFGLMAPSQNDAASNVAESGKTEGDKDAFVVFEGQTEEQVAPVQSSTPDAEAQPESSPDKISFEAGQLYSEVRESLIRNGYEPALNENSNQCWQWDYGDGLQCFDRPEISDCSGTGMGFCGATWYKGSRTINLIIQEGPDGILNSASESTVKHLDGR